MGRCLAAFGKSKQKSCRSCLDATNRNRISARARDALSVTAAVRTRGQGGEMPALCALGRRHIRRRVLCQVVGSDGRIPPPLAAGLVTEQSERDAPFSQSLHALSFH